MNSTDNDTQNDASAQKTKTPPPVLPTKFQCGAKTRSGVPCQNPPTGLSIRCRMHGGSGSGAPKGNKNALKHGYYTAKAIQARQELAALRREAAAYDNSWIDAVLREIKREQAKKEATRTQQARRELAALKREAAAYDNSWIDAVLREIKREHAKKEATRTQKAMRAKEAK